MMAIITTTIVAVAVLVTSIILLHRHFAKLVGQPGSLNACGKAA